MEYKVIVDEKVEFWYNLQGQYHRENDLPAIIWSDGTRWWYKNGKKHRENGPAEIQPDGTVEYFLNGKRASEEEVMGKKKYTIEEIQNMKVSDLLYILTKK